MLHLSTLNTAAAMAVSLAQNGQTLAAAPGSVLSTLVQASCIPVNLQVDKLEVDLPVVIDAISQSTNSTAENASEHDRALADLADDVASAVAQHLNVAQNVVSPMVMTLGNRLLTLLENIRPTNPANAFQIIQLSLPAPLRDEGVAKEAAQYKGLRTKNIVTGMGFGMAPSADELRQKLADSGFENAKDISKWAATVSEAELLAAWQSFFENNGRNFGVTKINDFGNANLWFAIWLLTYHFKDNVASNGMNLNEYNAALTSIRDVAGVELSMLIGQAESMESTGTVVLNDDHLKHCITVYAPTYNKWLGDGGTVEALLGMSVGDRTVTTISDLKNQAETLVRSWNAWIGFKTTEARAQFPDLARNLVSSAFIESLNEITDVEKEYYGDGMTRRDAVVVQSNQYIKGLTTSDLDKPFDIAFRLVAEQRFHFTAAGPILSDINTTLTHSQHTDPQEAATIAALHYVADFLADQIGAG